MSVVSFPQNGLPAIAVSAEEIRAAFEHRLHDAWKQHQKEFRIELWEFTADAAEFFVNWLSVMRPELARDYLHALADSAATYDPAVHVAAMKRCAETRAALLDSIRAQKIS